MILSEKSVYGYILLIHGHPEGQQVILKVKNKMALSYFKVNMIFQQFKPGTSECNTSFSCDLDWEIHFLYYFYDSRSSSRSKSQFQGQITKKYHLQQIKLRTCVIPLFHFILSEKSIYGIILLIQGHLQGRKVIFKVKNVKI